MTKTYKSNHKLKLLIILFVYFIVRSFATEFIDRKVLRESFVAGIGENLSFTCTENKSNFVTTWNYFESNHKKEKVFLSDGNILVLKNVSQDSSGIYECSRDNRTIKFVDIQVKAKDEPPILISCETNGLLTNFHCCWTGLPYANTSYTIYYNISFTKIAESYFDLFTFTPAVAKSNPSFMSHVNCRQPIKSLPICCSINLPAYAKKNLDVILFARCGNFSFTNEYKENPYDWVIADPPVYVNLSNHEQTTNGKSATSLLVEWSRPIANQALPLVYRLEHRLSNSNDTWNVEEMITERHHVITNLLPGAEFDVRVASMPDPHKHLFQGNWGEWGGVVTFETTSKKPTLRLHFEKIRVIISDQSPLLEVAWFPFSIANQKTFYYKIEILIGNLTRMFKTRGHKLSVQLELNSLNKGIVVDGYACNLVGCSPKLSENIEVTKVLPAVENVTLQINQGGYTAKWNALFPQGKCLIQLKSCLRQSLDLASVFSTNNENGSCSPSKVVQETEVKCQESRFSANLPLTSCEVYVFVIGRIIRHGNHEIISMSPAVQSQFNSFLPTIEGLKLSTDEIYNSSYYIAVEWGSNSSSVCNTTVDDLYVVYSTVGQCADKICSQDSFYRKKVDCGKGSKNITKNIFGGLKYTFGLAHCCSEFDSSFCSAATKHLTTIETTIGAPSMPLKLSWETGNTVKITWLPPEHPNGPIHGYSVRYGDPNQTDVTGIINTQQRLVELPVTCQPIGGSYWVEVSAYNEIGLDVLEGVSAFSDQSPACMLSNQRFRDLFVALAICLIFVVVFITLCHYHRQKVKKFVRNRIWSTIPTPQILLELTLINGDGNEVIRTRSTSMQEIPQSFTIGQTPIRHSDTAGTTYDKNDANEYSPLMAHDLENNQRENENADSGLSSFISGPHPPHSPYSVVSQLHNVSADEYASVECAAPSWRSWMYPRSCGTSVAASSQRRSSYSGFSLVPIYVREKSGSTPGTSGLQRIAPAIADDLNYARIAGSGNVPGGAGLDEDEQDIFAETTQQLGHGLRRVESWYDRSILDNDDVFSSFERTNDDVESDSVSKFSRPSVSHSSTRKISMTSCDSIDAVYPGVKNARNEALVTSESYLTLGQAVEMGVVSPSPYDVNNTFVLPVDAETSSNVATIGSVSRDSIRPIDNTWLATGDVTTPRGNDAPVLRADAVNSGVTESLLLNEPNAGGDGYVTFAEACNS